MLASPAAAQGPTPDGADAGARAAALDRIRADAFSTRRTLAWVVAADGAVGLAAGGAMLVPSGDDLAIRFAGIDMLVFGAINAVVDVIGLAASGPTHGAPVEEATRALRPQRP